MTWSRVALERLQYGSWYALLVFLPFSKAVIEISFALLLIGWLGERLLYPQTMRSSPWATPALRGLRFALASYLGFCVLATLSSTDPYLSLEGLIGKTLEYALLFVIAVDLTRDPKAFRRSLTLLMISAGLVGLDSLAQELLGKDIRGYALSAYHRMTGPYENPSDLATFLMVVVPLALSLAVTMGRGRRALLWGLVILLSGCLIRTESLGAWGGLAMALPILLMSRRFHAVLGVFGAGLLVGGGWFLHLQGRLSKVLSLSDVGGFVDRIPVWQAAVGMIWDRPLLGQGLNTFMANYLHYWVGGEQMPRYAHNCYLQTAAEIGLIGLAAFLWLVTLTIVLVIREARRHHEAKAASLLLGVSAGLLAFLVQSIVDTNFYALRQAVLFWALAGLAVGYAAHARSVC